MIKESAIRKDGIVYTGKRHNNILCDKSRPFGFLRTGEQGFVTDTGVFLNRIEALQHAIECRQIKSDTNLKRLHSEDLY
jgi:hypothetical protein